MARNTSLFLRIGEAKHLPAKDLSGTSDPYCVIKVDNEQVARTATVWKNLSPFWGEEYTLHLPNGFHQVSLYVYDEDIVSGDDIIGKVTLTRDTVRDEPKGVERWFEIVQVDRDREIQGEIHLSLLHYTHMQQHYLKVNCKEARDLAPKDMTGSSDPYVKVTFLSQSEHTQAIKGSRFPKWNREFELEIPTSAPANAKISFAVWDWDRVGGDDFMGQVDLRLSDLQLNKTFDQWFRLQPKEQVEKNRQQGDLGTIRIRARLTEERILPSQYYKPLIQLLVDSLSPEKHLISESTPLKMLQEVMTLDLMELSKTLVKLFLGQGKVVAYIEAVCTEEINSTSNPATLFRGNSLATKSVDQFMKIVGMPYLHDTLGSIIDQIYSDHKAVELDPGRLDTIKCRRPSLKAIPSDEELISHSRDVLLGYLEQIKHAVFSSVAKIPPVMRLVFKKLRARIEEKWPGPENIDHKYVGVSGFLFLRLLAPAILSPKLFSLKAHHPAARTSRTLTLLAKTVQNLGNLGLQIGLGKEQWMVPLHPFILSNISNVKSFIDEVVQIEDTVVNCGVNRRRSVFHPSVTIQQGHLLKKRWDRVKLRYSCNFSKRYFWLKFDNLAYAKRPQDPVRTTIQTSQICAVERVDKHAFSRSNMGQVIYRNCQGVCEVLYFQAKDINDMYSWISSIRKTIITNTSLLDTYHPGAFRYGKWTCCLKRSKEDCGCSKAHSQATIGDWRDPLDPDVEAQTIYSQLYHGRENLRQKYLESTEAVKEVVNCLQHQEEGRMSDVDSNSLLCSNRNTFQDVQDAQIAAAAQLLDVVKDLQKAHDAFTMIEDEQNLKNLQPESECSNDENEAGKVK